MRNMRLPKIFMSAAVILSICYQGCVKVPFESIFPKTINTSEEDVKSFSNRIQDELKNADIATLAKGKATDIPACQTAFAAFVDRVSGQGLIPYRKVTPKEYAPAVATFCPTIDMVKEIRRALLKEGEKDKDEKTLIDLSTEAKSFKKHGCSGPILDSRRGKFELSFLKTVVEKNSLNTYSVPTQIYYSTKTISEEDINTQSALKELIANGTLRPFGMSGLIDPKATGSQPITITVEGKNYEDAIHYILALQYQLVAIPVYEKFQPFIETIGTEKYYVVPQGGMVSKLGVDFVVEFSGKDAQCIVTETNKKYSE